VCWPSLARSIQQAHAAFLIPSERVEEAIEETIKKVVHVVRDTSETVEESAKEAFDVGAKTAEQAAGKLK
jgi:hypothetical protein